MIDVLKRLAELDAANPNVIREGSIQQGVWTANAPKPGQPDIAPPMPDEGPTTNQPFTIDQAKRHPSYRTDPKFKAEVDKAERFANGLGKKWDQNKPAPTNPEFKSIRGNVPSPDDMATSPPPRNESAGIREARSDYTTDEMVAMLTKQKTQQQVDAEAERTRGPDKGQTQQPNNSTSQRPTPTTTMKESLDLAECGPMGMPSEVEHHTPASINMTADSGPELSGMLADIMKLAGVHKVEPEHLGIEHDPVVITAMPGAAVGAAAADHNDMEHDHDDSIEVVDEPSDMRRMMDMMNPDMDEEVDETGYTNTPNDPNIIPEFDPEIYANHENQPDQGDRMDGNMPKAHVTMEDQLMADWKQFMTEGVAEGEGKTQKYEMMLKNGQVKKFIAKDDADAKRIAAGHSAKSVIKMKGDVPGDKIAEQGVAEGDSGAKYRVQSIGNKINPATGKRCDYYINPVTDEEVFCKPGQTVSKGDHVNPTTGKVTPKV